MTPLIRTLLGHGSKDRETVAEMQAILHQMQQERGRNEEVVERVCTAMDRLQELAEPTEKAGADVDDVSSRLRELEERFAAMAKLAEHYQAVADRAEILTQDQERAESRISEMVDASKQANAAYEHIGQRIDQAIELKDRLESFLDVDRPFQVLKGDADAIRAQVEGTGEQVARLREQHDRLLDQHKLAVSKMEAMDRRREDLGRDMQDKERRVAGVEQAVRGMDGIQQTVEEVRRQVGTLKALGDFVAQKTAGLEAQRDAVETAVARAEHLDRTMRQIDAGLRQAEENERNLSTMQEQVASLQSLHETVVDRSREITQLQRQADQQAQSTRQDLAVVRDEMKSAMERFEFESKGLESVGQRVADLRGAVSDLENRFKPVSEASLLVSDLRVQTQSLTAQLQGVAGNVGRVSDDLTKLQTLRRDLDEAERTILQVGIQATRIEQSRPALETAIRDVEQLSSAHARVKDALETTQITHDEIERLRESQAETRTWITSVEQSIGELRDQATELRKFAPMIEATQKKADRVQDCMSAIDARREFFDDMQRRVAELGSVSSRLEERSRQLGSRLDTADQQFTGLTAHAEEAERMTHIIGDVSSGLREAAQETDAIVKSVAAIEARCGSVEGIAEKTRVLGQEIEQRQQALETAAKDLRKASELRQQAAAATQQLDEHYQRLTVALSAAKEQASQIDTISTRLEDRTAGLQAVDRQLTEFEERMAKWNVVDEEITRSLEQIASRQGTIESLRGDLERMFTMAEKTAMDVRSITSSQREIAETRGLLEEHQGRLREIRETASSLDERQRQMTKAEERLARADALLVDVRGSLEALQGQKALVDLAIEKAGSLRFLLKQAEATIDGFREERKMTADVRAARELVAQGDEDDEEVARTAA